MPAAPKMTASVVARITNLRFIVTPPIAACGLRVQLVGGKSPIRARGGPNEALD
jgi:hypothetical protein